MRGELREKFMSDLEELIGDYDREGAVAKVAKSFIDEMEAAFGEIHEHLDNGIICEIEQVNSAYLKADKYVSELY